MAPGGLFSDGLLGIGPPTPEGSVAPNALWTICSVTALQARTPAEVLCLSAQNVAPAAVQIAITPNQARVFWENCRCGAGGGIGSCQTESSILPAFHP